MSVNYVVFQTKSIYMRDSCLKTVCGFLYVLMVKCVRCVCVGSKFNAFAGDMCTLYKNRIMYKMLFYDDEVVND